MNSYPLSYCNQLCEKLDKEKDRKIYQWRSHDLKTAMSPEIEDVEEALSWPAHNVFQPYERRK